MAELLAPAGTLKKLKTAFRFGADAVYFAGKEFGLRAYAGNFTEDEIRAGISYAHLNGKKAYIAVNIFPYNADFGALGAYFDFLKDAGADAAIVSDFGAARLALRKGLTLHVSTQANVTNRYAADAWAELGVRRIVLAREMNLADIRETAEALAGRAETEVFVHGAMCMAYSGRCMLSTYLTGRDGNRGECAQPCRREYEFREISRPQTAYAVAEDARGTYLFNSKDLSAMPILREVVCSGVSSLKIEGRMKSEYYVATVTNVYRRALDALGRGETIPELCFEELEKIAHRAYTTGFFTGKAENLPTESKPRCGYDFAAEVWGYDRARGLLTVEQRNRFREGDLLEIVSPEKTGSIRAERVYDADGNRVGDAKLVQQKLWIETDTELAPLDVLRVRRG